MAACCGQTQPTGDLPSMIGDTADLLARPIAEFKPTSYKFQSADVAKGQEPKLFESNDLTLVLAQIVQYRYENKMPAIRFLRELVIDYTMRSNADYAPYTTYYQTNEQVHLSAKEYLLGAVAYAKAKLTADEDLFVPQEQAEKRALTCLNCPRHVPILNGHTVNSPSLAQSKFAQLAQGKTTTVDGALHICGVCTCLCRAKVHFNLDFIKSSSTTRLLQEFKETYVGLNGKDHQCWIGKELLEQKPK